MFNLISTYETIQRRDEPIVAGTGDAAGHNPLNPLDARPYVIGEWLEHDDDLHFRRGGDAVQTVPGTPDDEADRASFPFFLERGRYDMQGIAGRPGYLGGKATVLYLGAYEFETDLYDDTGLVVGSALGVFDITIDGVVRRCLAAHVAGIVMARVTYIDATAGTLRAIRVYA